MGIHGRIMGVANQQTAATREVMVVVGLATVGLAVAAVVTLAPYALARPPTGPVPVVEISAPNAPLP